MIQAKDLRIGNIANLHVNHTDVEQISILPNDLLNIYQCEVAGKPSNYSGIPITEEWLLKAGFEKRIENAGNLICYKHGLLTHTSRDLVVAKWLGGKYQIWVERFDLNRIYYIHQLQNLYQSLTGSELSIPPTSKEGKEQ